MWSSWALDSTIGLFIIAAIVPVVRINAPPN